MPIVWQIAQGGAALVVAVLVMNTLLPLLWDSRIDDDGIVLVVFKSIPTFRVLRVDVERVEVRSFFGMFVGMIGALDGVGCGNRFTAHGVIVTFSRGRKLALTPKDANEFARVVGSWVVANRLRGRD